ncbi:hypothetical protein FB45DRAFT_1044454 [Roridomyces roridus]|uniref:F-box domain-containing protein n=1 Tax=Roridomyces roridus TaxID=1738132 RepID=A0AAD7AXX9_9AGAR|nr:hypothetical protein FB45DRAFT_1044454 [Roridomyces roridus]
MAWDNEPRLFVTPAPPLVLSHVCRHWMNVALCTPQLWTSLEIILPLEIRFPAEFRRLTSALGRWFSRSGSLPLTLSFVPWSWSTFVRGYYRKDPARTTIDDDVRPEAVPIAFQTLLRTLLKFSPRLKVLKLNALEPVYVQEVFQNLSPGDLPTLQTAVVKGCRQPQLPFLMAGNLRVVTLSPPSLASANSIFWEGIEQLELMSSRGCTDTHHRCPICFPSSAVPLHLGRLERLSVGHRWLPVDAYKNCFRNWVLPNLRSLEYKAPDWWDEGETPHIMPLLLSASALTTLVLSVGHIAADALLETLSAARELDDLTIQFQCTEPPVPDDFLAPLTPSTTHGIHRTVLCPRLRNFSFLNVLISDEAVLDFILARTDPEPWSPDQCVRKLESVKVRFPRAQEVDLVALLDERIAHGLDVQFIYGFWNPSVDANR